MPACFLRVNFNDPISHISIPASFVYPVEIDSQSTLLARVRQLLIESRSLDARRYTVLLENAHYVPWFTPDKKFRFGSSFCTPDGVKVADTLQVSKYSSLCSLHLKVNRPYLLSHTCLF